MPKSFANLRALMVINGYRSCDLATKIGLSYQQFSQKLTKKNDFTLTEIKKIIEIFDTPFETIFFDSSASKKDITSQ